MKLQFLKPYPNSSITEAFDDIEINDFTVITWCRKNTSFRGNS